METLTFREMPFSSKVKVETPDTSYFFVQDVSHPTKVSHYDEPLSSSHCTRFIFLKCSLLASLHNLLDLS